jgi:hypothetical protein
MPCLNYGQILSKLVAFFKLKLLSLFTKTLLMQIPPLFKHIFTRNYQTRLKILAEINIFESVTKKKSFITLTDTLWEGRTSANTLGPMLYNFLRL